MLMTISCKRLGYALAALSAIAAEPVVVHAQGAARAKSAASCLVNRTAAWMKQQAAFFDDSKHDWSDDALRTQLLAAAGISAPLATPAQPGVEIQGREPKLGPTADVMRDSLRKLAAVKGSTWPTRSIVGAAGTHAVYLLSLSDTALARVALHRMMEAGPAESPAPDVATFEDHMRLVWGRKQIYGTQFKQAANGAIVLLPMEDSAHADLRREDAGLPPFSVGLCMAKSERQ
jgi:hypothetical protein